MREYKHWILSKKTYYWEKIGIPEDLNVVLNKRVTLLGIRGNKHLGANMKEKQVDRAKVIVS